MHIERWLRFIAGFVVLASLTLSFTVSANWLFLTAFVGLNLLQSGITNWCPMVWVLERAGAKPCMARHLEE
jgi:hypothetical protein